MNSIAIESFKYFKIDLIFCVFSSWQPVVNSTWKLYGGRPKTATRGSTHAPILVQIQ